MIINNILRIPNFKITNLLFVYINKIYQITGYLRLIKLHFDKSYVNIFFKVVLFIIIIIQN